MKIKEEIKGIIKKRYAMFKEAINAEVKDCMNENIHYENKKADIELDTRFIQRAAVSFEETQIIITLDLSESIYNTEYFTDELFKDADNE